MEPQQSIEVQLIKLMSDKYSVPKGTLGAITWTHPEDAKSWDDVVSCAVTWVGGGGSVPILKEDLILFGRLWIEISNESILATHEWAKVELPEWIVKAQAKKMVRKILDELS